MDHRQFTIIVPSRYLKLELFGTTNVEMLQPSLGLHSLWQIQLMYSNFYGHRLEHVVSPALSALLFRRSAVPRFSAVSVLVRCLTELLCQELVSLDCIRQSNAKYKVVMLAIFLQVEQTLAINARLQRDDLFKSSGMGIGVLTLPSKLVVLEQSGLNLEDRSIMSGNHSRPRTSYFLDCVGAEESNQEQTSFAVEIENRRTQWYVMTVLLSLETKLK